MWSLPSFITSASFTQHTTFEQDSRHLDKTHDIRTRLTTFKQVYKVHLKLRIFKSCTITIITVKEYNIYLKFAVSNDYKDEK